MCGGTSKPTNGTEGQIERARDSNDVLLGKNLSCTKLDERIRKSLRHQSVSCVSKVTRLLQNRYACNFLIYMIFDGEWAFVVAISVIIMCLKGCFLNNCKFY